MDPRLHGDDPEAAERAAREVRAEAEANGAEVVVVSACLLGERTRYDGGDKLAAEVAVLAADPRVRFLPLCPELLAGMGCPRPPVHFAADGRIVDDAGRDRTEEMRRGAERALELAKLAGARRAILKERSPSCGTTQVHGPQGLQPGRGIFADLLGRRHLPVLSEVDVVKRKPDEG
jgi:uncharacterized protein YbbK (DUF523 family)